MYNNKLFSINFNLKQICRELKKNNIQFSTDGRMMISILPMNIHITGEKYIAIYQDHNTIKRIKNPDLSKVLLTVINKSKNIKTEVDKDITSVFNLHILLTRNSIVCMQNGRIL